MLRKWIQVLFFSMSLFFIGAHTLVPHQHDAEKIVESSSTPCWLKLLADVMHNDLGEEHLEEYEVGTNSFKISPSLFLVAILDFSGSFELIEESTKELKPFADPRGLVTSAGIHTSVSFRGPPVA